MSTPDQPDTPPLTRKRLREQRNTGITPVITEAEAAAAARDNGAQKSEALDVEPTSGKASGGKASGGKASGGKASGGKASAVNASAGKAPGGKASDPEQVPGSQGDEAAPSVPDAREADARSNTPTATPVVVTAIADAEVDLGTTPLTRRQARQHERIRTASVPVITPETSSLPLITAVPDATTPVDATLAAGDAGPVAPAPALPTPDASHPLPAHLAAPAEDDLHIFEEEGGPLDPEESRSIVHPALGAGLLEGTRATPQTVSFDQLLQRDTATTGSVASPSTLIVLQTPSGSPLVAPVAATGEVIVTGSWSLPEGMGSTGHAPGTTDGKDIDAALDDSELPTHSSPTPIAASAAISTAVTPEEIITPPAPEKGNKVMVTLAVTAGVLAVALIGVLVFALATGVFK